MSMHCVRKGGLMIIILKQSSLILYGINHIHLLLGPNTTDEAEHPDPTCQNTDEMSRS